MNSVQRLKEGTQWDNPSMSTDTEIVDLEMLEDTLANEITYPVRSSGWRNLKPIILSDNITFATNNKLAQSRLVLDKLASGQVSLISDVSSFDIQNFNRNMEYAFMAYQTFIPWQEWRNFSLSSLIEQQQKRHIYRKGIVTTLEAAQFCSEHRITKELLDVLHLAIECFPTLAGLKVEKLCDPESNDEWILVTAQVNGPIETVLDCYEDYTGQLINSVPWPQRNKIRFSYDLI